MSKVSVYIKQHIQFLSTTVPSIKELFCKFPAISFLHIVLLGLESSYHDFVKVERREIIINARMLVNHELNPYNYVNRKNHFQKTRLE